MNNKKILLVGFGQLASQLAPLLSADGFSIAGVKRSKIGNQPSDIEMHCIDVTDPSQLKTLPVDFEQVIITLTPDELSESHYLATYKTGTQNLLTHFSAQQSAAQFILISSTRVYQQNAGEWVDEKSLATNPESKAAILKAAEDLLWKYNPEHIVLRLSGIYGGNRNHLLKRIQKGISVQKEPASYTNRIHQQDVVGVIRHIVNLRSQNESVANLYLVSDDDPAPLWDVANWIAQEYDFKPPSEKPLHVANTQNKRCDNSQLKKLGYKLLYPSFRDGYKTPIKRN